MSAFIRGLAQELLQGFSTALALWATPACPACTCSPVVHCAEPVRCPDCIVDGAARVCPRGAFLSSWLFGFLAICIGFACGWIGHSVVGGGKVLATRRALGKSLEEEARLQVAEARRRRA